jgi:hypothetical protein
MRDAYDRLRVVELAALAKQVRSRPPEAVLLQERITPKPVELLNGAQNRHPIDI